MSDNPDKTAIMGQEALKVVVDFIEFAQKALPLSNKEKAKIGEATQVVVDLKKRADQVERYGWVLPDAHEIDRLLAEIPVLKGGLSEEIRKISGRLARKEEDLERLTAQTYLDLRAGAHKGLTATEWDRSSKYLLAIDPSIQEAKDKILDLKRERDDKVAQFNNLDDQFRATRDRADILISGGR